MSYYSMKKILLLAFLALLSTLVNAKNIHSETQSMWVELGQNNNTIARFITSSKNCPLINIDNKLFQMQPRAVKSTDFPVTVCEALIPKNAQHASINHQNLPLPNWNIKKIVVMGDTGCRLKKCMVCPFFASINVNNIQAFCVNVFGL